MFLHNLSQRNVSALSWAIFRFNTLVCEVNHTINNVILLLSTRTRVTSIKFIHLKLIILIVELKCYHNIKGKGKVIPLQSRCGPEGGQRYSSILP